MDRDAIIRTLAEQLEQSDARDDLAAASVLYSLMGALASGHADAMSAHLRPFNESMVAMLTGSRNG